jgi:hypothetical protein
MEKCWGMISVSHDNTQQILSRWPCQFPPGLRREAWPVSQSITRRERTDVHLSGVWRPTPKPSDAEKHVYDSRSLVRTQVQFRCCAEGWECQNLKQRRCNYRIHRRRPRIALIPGLPLSLSKSGSGSSFMPVMDFEECLDRHSLYDCEITKK